MGCPDDDVLAAVADGCATAEQRARVETHIDTCRECAALIADAVRLVVADRVDTDGSCRYVASIELGRGGMGQVFRAFDPRLERDVALKVIADALGAGEEDRLLREARALAKLSHPNIVEVFDVGRQRDGSLFIAMELVRGPTLSRWLGRRPSWREVVHAFVGAGAGLAAAHAAGVVHRDFKPGNVMIDEASGRVRVMDFGLARGLGDDELESDDDASVETYRGSALVAPRSGRVTEAGTVVGTLPYLAPELLMGETADAASDQYAFCVALYEALTGSLPYPGNLAEQRRAKLESTVRWPTSWDGPGWLQAAVSRGLAPEPARRWPSMDMLTTRLRSGGAPRRRVLVSGAALLGIAGVVGLATPSAVPTCEQATLDPVWGPEIEQALTALPDSTIEDVQRRLQRYADTWAATHRRACTASEGKDVRMACLSRARTEVATVVDRLRAGLQEPAGVVTAVRGLPDPEDCADVEVLTMAAPPPSDPATAALVDQARTAIARCDALERLGLYEQAQAALASADDPIDRADYPPLTVEAEFRRGWLQERDGDYEAAATTLERVLTEARGAGHDEIAAKAVVRLAFVLADRLGRTEAAMSYNRTADALVRAIGDPPRLRADYWRSLAATHRKDGNYEAAAAAFEAECDILRATVGTDDRLYAVALSNLGQVYSRLGRDDDAKSLLQRSYTVFARTVGPDHMYLAYPLNALAVVEGRLGNHDEAYRHMQRAVEVNEAGRGPDHPMVRAMLNNLGAMAYRAGHAEDARRYFQRVVDLHREYDPSSDNIPKAKGNLALIAFDSGDLQRARLEWESTLMLLEDRLGPEHPELVPTLSNLGDLYTDIDRADDAVVLLRRGLRIERKAKGEDSPDLAGLLARLAQAEFARGEDAAAARNARQALALADDEHATARANEILQRLEDR